MASATEQGSTVLNKIIIPVLTTVLGATAIYFLGFNKKSDDKGRTPMEQLLISKDATVKAWKSFVTSQNVAYSSAKSLNNEYEKKFGEAAKESLESYISTIKDYENDYMRESKKTNSDIELILKDADIDKDFVSMLNRSLENGKDWEKKFTTYIDDMISLIRSDIDPQQKGTKLQTEINKFQEKMKNDLERMVAETESLAKVLADRYTQAFNLNELDAYVDVKKPDLKKQDTIRQVQRVDDHGQAPIDPNNPDTHGGGQSVVDNPTNNPTNNPQRNDPSVDYRVNNNPVEPTKTSLTGQWSMYGGTLELSADGRMFWMLDGKGYTSGSWKLVNGKIQMNATNPDTGLTSLLIGEITNFNGSAFTLTLMSTPREVYNFTKKKPVGY